MALPRRESRQEEPARLKVWVLAEAPLWLPWPRLGYGVGTVNHRELLGDSPSGDGAAFTVPVAAAGCCGAAVAVAASTASAAAAAESGNYMLFGFWGKSWMKQEKSI